MTASRGVMFNPATDTDPRDVHPDAPCENCGRARYLHRDGGMVYGLVCPSQETPEQRGIRSAPEHPEEGWSR